MRQLILAMLFMAGAVYATEATTTTAKKKLEEEVVAPETEADEVAVLAEDENEELEAEVAEKQ